MIYNHFFLGFVFFQIFPKVETILETPFKHFTSVDDGQFVHRGDYTTWLKVFRTPQ